MSSAPSGLPRDSGPVRRIGRDDAQPRRSPTARLLLALITALAAALAIAGLAAVQTTDRDRAQTTLARLAASLVELDRIIDNQWTALRLAAFQNPQQPIQLQNLPSAFEIDPATIIATPSPTDAVDAIAADWARLLYDEGWDIVEDSPRANSAFLSQASAFDSTIGRITSGGHLVAWVLLGVGLALLGPLALLALTGAAGPMRLAPLGIGLALGGAAALIVALLLGAWFDNRADTALDAFTVDLWRTGADTAELLARDGAVAALLGVALFAIALAGAWGERQLRQLIPTP